MVIGNCEKSTRLIVFNEYVSSGMLTGLQLQLYNEAIVCLVSEQWLSLQKGK